MPIASHPILNGTNRNLPCKPFHWVASNCLDDCLDPLATNSLLGNRADLQLALMAGTLYRCVGRCLGRVCAHVRPPIVRALWAHRRCGALRKPRRPREAQAPSPQPADRWPLRREQPCCSMVQRRDDQACNRPRRAETITFESAAGDSGQTRSSTITLSASAMRVTALTKTGFFPFSTSER